MLFVERTFVSLLILSVTANHVVAEVPAPEMVKALSTANSRIKHFAVELVIDSTRCFETEPRKLTSLSARLKSLPQENWVKETRKYRQLYSRQKDQRPFQRIDRMEADGGLPISIVSFDGSSRRTFYRDSHSGLIGYKPAQGYSFADKGHSYLEYLGHRFYDKNIEEIFSNPKTVLEHEDGQVVLHSPPTFDRIPGSGYRIWLDLKRELAVKRFVYYKVIPTKYGGDNREHVKDEIVVHKHLETSPGVWVPVKATRTSYATRGVRTGQPNYLLDMTVVVKDSRWNIPLTAGEFAFDFSPGTKVHDEIFGVDIVVGGQGGRDTAIMMLDAIKVTPTNERSRKLLEGLPNVAR